MELPQPTLEDMAKVVAEAIAVPQAPLEFKGGPLDGLVATFSGRDMRPGKAYDLDIGARKHYSGGTLVQVWEVVNDVVDFTVRYQVGDDNCLHHLARHRRQAPEFNA